MLTRVALPIRQAVGGILAILIIILCGIGVFVVLSKQRKKKVRRHTFFLIMCALASVCSGVSAYRFL